MSQTWTILIIEEEEEPEDKFNWLSHPKMLFAYLAAQGTLAL